MSHAMRIRVLLPLLLLAASPAAAFPAINATVTATGVTVIAMGGPGNPKDWVSVESAVGGGGIQSWAYLSGTTTPPAKGVTMATITFPLPPKGSYVARFYANDSFANVLATSATFGVGNSMPPAGTGVSSLTCMGSVQCPKASGDVVITGTSDASMAECSTPPAIGSACNKGGSCYSQSAIANSTDLGTDIYLCAGKTLTWSKVPTMQAKTK